jgi:hypothetical protein
MQPEETLWILQETTTTGPYPEPDELRTHPHYFFKIHFNIILPPTFRCTNPLLTTLFLYTLNMCSSLSVLPYKRTVKLQFYDLR